MKKCANCGIDKELSAFNRHPKTKDGLHTWCKECFYKARDKRKEELKIEYKTLNYGDDGYGGKWYFDINRLNEPLLKTFAQTHGQVMSKRKKIYQIKSKNKQQITDFATCIGMSENGIIFIEREPGKEHLECFVVNLYHQDIVSALK